MFEVILSIYAITGIFTATMFLIRQYLNHGTFDKDDIKVFLIFSAIGFVGPIIWGIVLFIQWWLETEPLTVIAKWLTKLFDSVLKTKDATEATSSETQSTLADE